MRHRFTLRWRVRRWLGGIAQVIAWRLCDPHDNWVIDYRDKEGRMFGVNALGFYSMARCRARELKGEVVGTCSKIIPTGPDEPWSTPESHP